MTALVAFLVLCLVCAAAVLWADHRLITAQRDYIADLEHGNQIRDDMIEAQRNSKALDALLESPELMDRAVSILRKILPTEAP